VKEKDDGRAGLVEIAFALGIGRGGKRFLEGEKKKRKKTTLVKLSGEFLEKWEILYFLGHEERKKRVCVLCFLRSHPPLTCTHHPSLCARKEKGGMKQPLF